VNSLSTGGAFGLRAKQCDTPQSTMQTALRFGTSLGPFDWVIWTGDNLRHGLAAGSDNPSKVATQNPMDFTQVIIIKPTMNLNRCVALTRLSAAAVFL
jgi:hypothetical protein